MAEVTQWIVSDLTKEDRTKLVELVEGWKVSGKLSDPRIKEIIQKGRKVEIYFPVGNARKIRHLLAKNGFPTVTVK